MKYIAHRSPEDGREQPLIDHLTAVAEFAASFAEPFGASEAAYRCGLLHDIGKYSELFQRRVRGAAIHVDHSTAGALEARERNDAAAAFCVAGHHGGLPDRGERTAAPGDRTLSARFKRRPGVEIEDYSAYRQEVTLPTAETPKQFLESRTAAFFYAHMLYSCLVDADWLDTERFMSNGVVQRGTGDSLPELLHKLEQYIASEWKDATGSINIRRSEILHTLMEAGNRPRWIYTLTVATGGGKTISSMAFALRHAIHTGARRVIYVIPYTSIIEQTQAVFEKIFGAENVVAHYANVTFKTDENGDMADADKRRYLATENWDAPIILTTAVQFFESLFANRSSKCRKLHNIANSVIIFDEAQMLPVNYLRPCLYAISELTRNYGCTTVLCTATQPSLEKLLKEFWTDMPPMAELCPSSPEADECFRRVSYSYDGNLSNDELSRCLTDEKQVLCVVNNRKQAQVLFNLLPEEGSFHLSTTMTGEHRRVVLKEVRQRLKDGKVCRVVSTSLIEAGVDVDFPTVYRAMAGLDSIIQAAGRCNREGKHSADESIVHIFDSETAPPRVLEQNISAAKHVLQNFSDIASPEAIKSYFIRLFHKEKDGTALDEKNILQLIDKDMAFETVAKSFRLIENTGYTVYIPLDWDDLTRTEGNEAKYGNPVPTESGADLTEKLRKNGPSRELLRKLGKYSVSVYERDYANMRDAGTIECISEDAAILLDITQYKEKIGLDLCPEVGRAIFS